MTPRSIAVFAVLGGIALAAVGYAVGVRNGGQTDRTELTSMVEDILAQSQSASTPPAADATETAGLTDEQQSQVEATIRNYLIANPEIVADAIDALRRKEDQAAQDAQTAAIKDNADLLFNSKNEVVLGNPKGDITLVEFFDYNCGYCRRANADMKKLIDEDPNLRLVLKEFPILSQGSVEAAQVGAAVLLTAPEKYADFHEELITAPGQADGAKALAVAADLGLDTDALKVKADSEEAKNVIVESHQLAEKLDLTGTPSYATPEKVIVGAVGYDALKQAIADARSACKAKTITC
jgi:protein-disulfide isomerase